MCLIIIIIIIIIIFSNKKKITEVEMRCYRRLLWISYTEHVTNDEVHRRIEEQIGPHIDLLTAMKMRILRWYGHVTRSN